MNTQRNANDTDDIECFDRLQTQYQALSTEEPELAIDKQIIAAAHQEIAQPNLKTSYHISWWRRMILPLYIAATFTFTAIAAHWFWPGAPMKTLPGTSPTVVSFEVLEPVSESNKDQKRIAKPVPELPTVNEPPSIIMPVASTKSLSQPPYIKIPAMQSDRILDMMKSTVKIPQVKPISTDNQSEQPAGHSLRADKEIWAREIIELFKKGDHVRAKKELVSFKQNFPEYPIDEQLEVLRH